MKFTEQEIEAMRKAAQMEAHKSIHDDYVYIEGSVWSLQSRICFILMYGSCCPERF